MDCRRGSIPVECHLEPPPVIPSAAEGSKKYIMTQDEKWEKEEHLMLNWVKQQRKLLNAGRLKEDRVGRVKELLALIEENKRVNQYD